MKELLLILVAYLIGSIPTALIISKHFFNIDIRNYGSGNMGATNTFRVLGTRFGTIVLILDILKGVCAVLLCYLIQMYHFNIYEDQRTQFMVALGLAAILGHLYPIFAGFKGGKGVATAFGMLLALQPIVALLCLTTFIFFMYLTRYVSLSSMMAAIFFPIMVLFIFKEDELLYKLFAIAVGILVVFAHKKNIANLLKGNESRANILKYRDKRKARRDFNKK